MGMVEQYGYTIKRDPEDGMCCVFGHLSDGNDITLGHPEYWGWTSADDDEIKEAFKILDDLWMDKNLGAPGRRNDDAVNMCIALHVLGCCKGDKWFALMGDFHQISAHDHRMFGDHWMRVQDYVSKWGPDGNQGQALEYIV